jgi:hypothetical protein
VAPVTKKSGRTCYISPSLSKRLRWQRLRRGVADLWRGGQVSQAANRRYLEALASVTGKTPLRPGSPERQSPLHGGQAALPTP